MILHKTAICLSFPKHVSQILLALYLHRSSSSVRTPGAQLQSCCTPRQPRHVHHVHIHQVQQAHTASLKHFCEQGLLPVQCTINESLCLGLTLLEGTQRMRCTSTYSPSILCRISHMLPASTGLTGYIQIIYTQWPTAQAPHCTWLQSSALAIPHKNMAAVISQVGESQLWQQSTTKVPLHIANALTFYTADFLTSYGRNLLFLSIWATFWTKLCFSLSLLLRHLLQSCYYHSCLLTILLCSYALPRSG